MRDIKELIENSETYHTVLYQKVFESKKNTVAYVLIEGKPRVLKWYVPGFTRNMENEYRILKKGSSHVHMPTVHTKDTENHVLVMDYIPGRNLCDVITDEQLSLKEKKKILELAAGWFSLFHTFFKTPEGFQIRGDPNVKNFILSHRHVIYGVDFEESRPGKPVEDIAGFCASLLSTNPMFTKEKFELCTDFIAAYSKSVKWTLEKVNEEVAYALLEKIQWRPEQEEILRKFATKIRTDGLKGR